MTDEEWRMYLRREIERLLDIADSRSMELKRTKAAADAGTAARSVKKNRKAKKEEQEINPAPLSRFRR